ELPEKAVEIPAFPRLREVIFASGKAETLQDRVAPAVREKRVRGGTRVLSDQAACPFRAFARHRLHAEELEEPAEGLDASKRGKLVHLLMQNVWNELKDSTALQGDLSPAIERAAAGATCASWVSRATTRRGRRCRRRKTVGSRCCATGRRKPSASASRSRAARRASTRRRT